MDCFYVPSMEVETVNMATVDMETSSHPNEEKVTSNIVSVSSIIQNLDSIKPFPDVLNVQLPGSLKTNVFNDAQPSNEVQFAKRHPPPQWVELVVADNAPESENVSTDDDEDVIEHHWTQTKLKTAHKIWLDTQKWENDPRTTRLLAEMDNRSNDLPRFYNNTYSTTVRPRRECGPRRFPKNCETWMLFSDVDHAVWIDCNGFADLSKRISLLDEVTKRVLIPSCDLQFCTVEQLKTQQDLLAELKRSREYREDVDYCPPIPNEADEISSSDSCMTDDDLESEGDSNEEGDTSVGDEGEDEEDDVMGSEDEAEDYDSTSSDDVC